MSNINTNEPAAQVSLELEALKSGRDHGETSSSQGELRESEINTKSIRRDLENVYAAFFARWEDWGMSSRFRMKGSLWMFLHSVTEAIKRDGLNTDPELLELASFAVRACRDLETERLSDLDELEEKIGSVEDIMILNRKRSVVVEEDLDALSPDKPEIF